MDFLEEKETHADLWEEDDEMCQDINQIIESIKDWGSLSIDFQKVIKESTQGKIDYRTFLRKFRTSIYSSTKELTRMRPNRRKGFEYLGGKYRTSSKLLVAVDVSGSISDKNISVFLRIINRFFSYGIDKIDVIQFDTEIKGEVLSLKKAQKNIKIQGRGGTDFQEIFDFLYENKSYDGIIIFTDGYAREPQSKFRTKSRVLWICESKDSYQHNKYWMIKYGKVTFIQ